MENIKKINEDTLKRTTTEIINLIPLKKELVDIEAQLIELEKQPDEILVKNEIKFNTIQFLDIRKYEINKLLKV